MKTKKQENSWTFYTKNSLVKLEGTSKEIIETFGNCNQDFFKSKAGEDKTNLIKKKLLVLGIKLHNKVCAHFPIRINDTLPKHENRELLFDMHWYKQGIEVFSNKSLELAMECEWKQDKNYEKRNTFAGIKYDFQKLIFCNAKLRLMIFKIKHEDDLKVLGNYFENEISNCENLEANARFLFVAFDSKRKSFHYKEIIRK